MRRVPLVLLLAVAVGTGACAASEPAAQPSPANATGTGATAGTEPGAGSSVGGAPSAGPSSAKPSRSAPAPSEVPTARPSGIPSGGRDNNTMPLTVTLDRSCYLTGQTLTAQIETLPGASIGMTVAYPDNTIVPDYHFVSKSDNVDGRFTWRFVIRSTVKGWSYVSTVTSKDDKGAVFDAPFRIASTC